MFRWLTRLYKDFWKYKAKHDWKLGYIVSQLQNTSKKYLDVPKFKDKNKCKKNAIFYAEIFTNEIAFGLPQIPKQCSDC